MNVNLPRLVLSCLNRGYPATSCELILKMQQPIREIDAEKIFQTIVEEDVSYFCAAPTVLNMLLEYYEKHEPQTMGANQVRIATGGSAPPEATIRTVEDELGWHLKHIYGATETGPLITTSDARRFFEDESARFQVKKRQGLGFLGTEIQVVDQEGNDVPRDDETIGEVVVSGNQVMEGYWEQPEVTKQAFNDRIDGYYHMGDLATVDEHGMIAIKDRKKDIIISGGENISSIELENTLYDHPAVAEVAVIPSPSEKWGELAHYKTVRRVEFVDELPTTSTGKIQKHELRAQEWVDEDSLIV